MAALGACSSADGGGFRPLYGPSASGPNVEQKLASVDFAPIPSRIGQRIRNELIFQGTGGGRAEAPVYRFEVALRERLTSTLVSRTGESQSQVYHVDASFRLIRISDKRVVLEGASHGRAGFERFTSIYSNVRAREDAENRAATTVAQDIRSRLAAFLSGSA